MNRKRLVSVLVGGTLTLVTIFGAVTYRKVNAQTPTPTSSDACTQTSPARGMRGAVSNQDLATTLGVTVEQLQAAQKSAAEEATKQAVSAGLITQDQADQYTQNGENNRPFGGMPFLRGSSIDYNSLLASALGITTGELQAANQKAYFASLDQAIQDGNMTQEQADAAKGRYALTNNAAYQSAMKSAYEAAVNQAVTDGVITQSQADQLLKENAGIGWGGPGGFGGHGRPGGRGGPGGMGLGGIPGTPPTDQTTPPAAPSSGDGL